MAKQEEEESKGVTRRQFLTGFGAGLVVGAGTDRGLQWFIESQRQQPRREVSLQEASIFWEIMEKYLQKASNPELFRRLGEFRPDHNPYFGVGYGSTDSTTYNAVDFGYHANGSWADWAIVIYEPDELRPPANQVSTRVDVNFNLSGVVDLEELAQRAQRVYLVPEELSLAPWVPTGPVVGQVSKERKFQAPSGFSYYQQVIAYHDTNLDYSQGRLVVNFPKSDTQFHYFRPAKIR